MPLHLAAGLLIMVIFPQMLRAEKGPKHRLSVPLPVEEKAQPPDASAVPSPNRPLVGVTGSDEPAKPAARKRKPIAAEELPPGDLCQAQHAIETYLQIAANTKPEAAREGGVFFVSDLRDAPQLFYLSSAAAWPEQLTTFPDGVAYYAVSPDKKKVLLANSVGGDEQYDLYLLNLASKKIDPLLVDRQDRINSVAWGPTSDWFLYTGNARGKETGQNRDMDLYRYDLKVGSTSLLTELPGSQSVSDVSPDGRYAAIHEYRSITDSDLLIWDQTEKRYFRVGKQNSEETNGPGFFTADSKQLLFISDRSGGKKQLFSIALSGSASAKLMTSEMGEVEELTLSPDRKTIAYLSNENGYSRIKGFQLDRTGKKQAPLIVPKQVAAMVTSVSFAPVHGRTAFFYSQTSPTQPHEVWLWTGTRNILWTKGGLAVIRPECFTGEELVHYPSFDGREIPAFLYLPKRKAGETAHATPFLVYVHGGPEAQTRPQFSKTFQYFLQRGFGIFAPNIRGSSGYGREYVSLDNYKKRMDSVRDVIEGTKWLIANGYTKKNKTAILGGSYGGFLVLRSIQVEPDLFAAASSSVGISNFVSFLKNTKPYRRQLREVEYGPLSDESFLKSISPVQYVDSIRTPLIIFHGANDPRVPVGETEQIIEAMKRRGVPVDHRIFSDEGHGNTKLRNILEQNRLMALFFEKHLEVKQ